MGGGGGGMVVGAGVIIAISLAVILIITTGFWHEKCQFLLLFKWAFLCDVMTNPLQNHECNISPCTVSHVNKFNEIKESNLNRIRPYLRFGKTN